jgi:hypothetical protein
MRERSQNGRRSRNSKRDGTGSVSGSFTYDDSCSCTYYPGGPLDPAHNTTQFPPPALPTVTSATGDMVGFLTFDWSGAFVLANYNGLFVEDGPSNTWFAFAFPSGGATLNAPLPLADFDANGYYSWANIGGIALARGSEGATVLLYPHTSETPVPLPLPATLPLFATGLGLMALLAWRRSSTPRGAAALAQRRSPYQQPHRAVIQTRNSQLLLKAFRTSPDF